MTLVPVPFRRRPPLAQPDPALPTLGQPGPVVTGPAQAPSGGTPTSASGVTPSAESRTPPEKPSSSKIPPRWAVSLVALVLLLASLLVGLGHPVSVVMEVLAAAGWLGVELVRQLNREF